MSAASRANAIVTSTLPRSPTSFLEALCPDLIEEPTVVLGWNASALEVPPVGDEIFHRKQAVAVTVVDAEFHTGNIRTADDPGALVVQHGRQISSSPLSRAGPPFIR